MKVLVNCEKVPLTALLNSQALVIIVTRPAPPRPGRIFSNSIKLMLERQKFTLYQQEMLLKRAKITLYQQDMPH